MLDIARTTHSNQKLLSVVIDEHDKIMVYDGPYASHIPSQPLPDELKIEGCSEMRIFGRGRGFKSQPIKDAVIDKNGFVTVTLTDNKGKTGFSMEYVNCRKIVFL